MKMRITRESVAHFQELLNDFKFTRDALEEWYKENMPENWHFGRLTISDDGRIGTIEIIDIRDGVSCATLKAQLLPWGIGEERAMKVKRTMKAKITNLIVGVQNLEVVYTEDIINSDGDSLAGQTDYDKGILTIDSSLTDENFRMTIMRSIVNGCARVTKLKMTEAQEKDFTYWLINTLIANPQLLEMFE